MRHRGGGSGTFHFRATVFHPFGDWGQWLPPSAAVLEDNWFDLKTSDVTSGVCRVPVTIDQLDNS